MLNTLKNNLRKILGVRSQETLSNYYTRKKTNLEKIFYKKKFDKNELRNELLEVGLEKGMTVFVHSSWRQFYNFKGTPIDVIDLISEIVGKNGTVLMPSYGSSREYFNVDESPSMAGVISEEFRKMDNVVRSHCTHFSVAAKGPLSSELIKKHSESIYGMDKNSPLYLMTKVPNSKILFLGLSDEPTTISLFHCVAPLIRNNNSFIKENVLNSWFDAQLVVNNKKYEKRMLARNPKYSNDKKIFKKIYNNISNKNIKKISNLDLVLIDTKEGFVETLEAAKRNEFVYKYNYFA